MDYRITLTAYTPTMTLFETNWPLSEGRHMELHFPIGERAKLEAGLVGRRLLDDLELILNGCHESQIAVVTLDRNMLGISVYEEGEHQVSVIMLTIRALVLSINEKVPVQVTDKRGANQDLSDVHYSNQ